MGNHDQLQKRPLRHSLRTKGQIVRERDFSLVADRLENLSTWGALVGPADPVLTGERVYVSFELPGTGHYIDTLATVKRVLHGRRPGDRCRQLGLQFDPLSQHDRFCIRRALLGRPLSPPVARASTCSSFDLRQLVA